MAIDPRSAQAYNNRGAVKYELGDRLSIIYYTPTIIHHPNYIDRLTSDK